MSAAVDAGVFSALFYAMAYLAWSASKTSWRARWAGPKECLEAKSIAARSVAAGKWLGRAGGRGMRCADVEMMRWIMDREMRQWRLRGLEQSVASQRESAQAAFKEINQGRLGALSERAELEGRRRLRSIRSLGRGGPRRAGFEAGRL